MKRIIILLGILVCITAAQVVFGQNEGTIIYEVKINMHRTIPSDHPEMKNMVPEFRTEHEQLFFNANESLYAPVEEDEDEEFNNGGGMRVRMQRPKIESYTNQNTMKKMLLQEFMGKKYLIEDSIKLQPWKLGAETKSIKGYSCKQASFFDEKRKQNVIAWYTDKLRPFLGPESFNTLPGAVLEVDINDGERIISAKTIELRPLKKNEIKVPSGGTKTTEREFRKMVDEHMERIRANGGNIMIRN